MAEETRKTAKTAAKKYTESEVSEMIKAAVTEALKTAQAQPTVVQVAKEEYVTIMYVGSFASGCVATMPDWGTITKGGETIDVPKKDFLHGIGYPLNSELLRTRRVIVLDGLTEAERTRYGVAYSANETLTKQAFDTFLDMGKDEACRVFSMLCDEHKSVVAQIYKDAYFSYNSKGELKSDKRVNPETVKALNNLSKTEEAKNGLFADILDDFGRRYAAE